jgi:hypothetical protein
VRIKCVHVRKVACLKSCCRHGYSYKKKHASGLNELVGSRSDKEEELFVETMICSEGELTNLVARFSAVEHLRQLKEQMVGREGAGVISCCTHSGGHVTYVCSVFSCKK